MKENDANEWIDKVLASAKGKEVPETSSFLFNKIEQKLSTKEIIFSPKMQLSWAIAATVLLILNIGVILFTGQETSTENTESYEQLSKSYFQNDSTSTTLFYSNLSSLNN